jgi:hypothetical protein
VDGLVWLDRLSTQTEPHRWETSQQGANGHGQGLAVESLAVRREPRLLAAQTGHTAMSGDEFCQASIHRMPR